MATEKTQDLTIFHDASFQEDCKDNCPSKTRIRFCLDYYQRLDTANARELFIEFCDAVYSAALLLDDYVHVITKHGDVASLTAMAAQLTCPCSSPSDCAWTDRHFRGRGRSKHKQGAQPLNFYVETMDTLHFNLFHLEHVGLRIHVADADAKAGDDQDLVDAVVLRMRDIIRLKREQFRFDRMDSAQNNKFTLVAPQQLQPRDAKGKQTRIANKHTFAHSHLTRYGQRAAAS